MDGEGSFSLSVVNSRGIENYRADVTFTNTDPELIRHIVKYLKKHKLNHYIRGDVRKNKKTCYQVSITKLEHKIIFIELVKEYLVGDKRYEAELVEEFCKSRLNCLKSYKATRDEKGRFVKGFKSPYLEREKYLYRKIGRASCRERV